MWLYILASQKNGTLYVGVTNSLSKRIEEHRDGRGSEFAQRYHVTRLVYAESYADPNDAIAQEKRIKHWRRSWKIDLIERANPDWNDLYPTAHLD
ncbi:Excinuclease ABC subunit C [Bosea sp. 62]|uniref:GIY-YIG nuclease family protein n=1 Tax=unclassified Bosea (in: a-proteobacteria) TaxID=2653178 RepID=UPI00125BF7E2|nr:MULTISPECIES: GIY-YIG nuclease family protein [unclassified Bosea (in: a-proteobacteria)]CAD5258279.1 Excinuclease ABC subunit C [Bosea sp. 46]CAD5262717.1 Excinuclease ABC subunit C [Bosea sp. 21B]CAD5277702.1 Excinuclease ABC subunit C [Bosea sp. 7B]VVT58799.1 Excinuclease ABC subunit C [Bosea sp. EC-HK365B]VXB60747.1 Excinuclease ABC subunit C [Bosea sp. 29B]